MVHSLEERWESAFFELLTARILQELGASVEFEDASSSGSHPDFLATFSDGAVIVEAKAPVINSAAEKTSEVRQPLSKIIESSLPPGWMVGVWDLPDIGPADSKKAFKRKVSEMLNLPPPRPEDRDRELVAEFPQGTLHLHLFPTGKEHQRLGLEAPISLVDNTEPRIRHIVAKARKQVRASEFPVLLAIHASGVCSDLEDFDHALYGRGFEELDRDHRVVATGFRADGEFSNKSDKPPTYAGVLAFLEMNFHCCSSPVLYLHPRFQGVLPKSLMDLERRWFDSAEGKIRSGLLEVPRLIEKLNLVNALVSPRRSQLSWSSPLFSCARGTRSALLIVMVAVIPKRTVRQVRREVRAMTDAAKQINKSAASSRNFLRKNGFITKQNKVSAHYR